MKKFGGAMSNLCPLDKSKKYQSITIVVVVVGSLSDFVKWLFTKLGFLKRTVKLLARYLLVWNICSFIEFFSEAFKDFLDEFWL